MLSNCDHKGNTRISNLLHHYKNKHPELADEFEIWLQGGEEPFPPPTAQGEGMAPQDNDPDQQESLVEQGLGQPQNKLH